MLVSLTRFVVLHVDHPSVPLDLEIDPLVVWGVNLGSFTSAIAVVWHAITLISDVDLGVGLSAGDTVLAVDCALGLFSATVWASNLVWVAC